jgi:hypothetical protein
LICAALLALLAACGGGDPERPDVPLPHLDCHVRPELCR